MKYLWTIYNTLQFRYNNTFDFFKIPKVQESYVSQNVKNLRRIQTSSRCLSKDAITNYNERDRMYERYVHTITYDNTYE